MIQSGRQRRLSIGIFIVYCVVAAWGILFKLDLNIVKCFNCYRGVNLIPLHFINTPNYSFGLEDVIVNIVLFIPFGVYIKFFCDKKKLHNLIGIFFATSISFEIVQYVFGLGATDINDVITNVLGACIGFKLAGLLYKFFDKKCVSIVNIIGLIFEIVGLGFYLLIVIYNGIAY